MKKTLAIKQADPLAVVVPKPTRSEILDAMVRLTIEKRSAEIKERDDKVKALTAEVDDLLVAFTRKNIGKLAISLRLGGCSEKWDGNTYKVSEESDDSEASVNIRADALPRSIVSRLVAISTLKRKRWNLDPAAIKRQIREGITGNTGERVTALLTTPQSRAALEQALEKIAA